MATHRSGVAREASEPQTTSGITKHTIHMSGPAAYLVAGRVGLVLRCGGRGRLRCLRTHVVRSLLKPSLMTEHTAPVVFDILSQESCEELPELRLKEASSCVDDPCPDGHTSPDLGTRPR